MNIAELKKDKRGEIRKQVDRILNMPDEKDRLREAFKLWLAVNPKIDVSYSDGTRAKVTAKVAYKQTLEKVRFLKSMHDNDLGIKDSVKRSHKVGAQGMRALMELPPGSVEFMRMFAMNLFTGSSDDQLKATVSLSKVFPELVVPRKL